MTARPVRRWLLGAVLVVAIACLGIGSDGAGASLARDPGAAAGAPAPSAGHPTDAVLPLRVAKLSVAERTAVKLPGLALILAAAAAVAAALPRPRFRGRRLRSRPSALLLRRALPRRGPPALSLA